MKKVFLLVSLFSLCGMVDYGNFSLFVSYLLHTAYTMCLEKLHGSGVGGVGRRAFNKWRLPRPFLFLGGGSLFIVKESSYN